MTERLDRHLVLLLAGLTGLLLLLRIIAATRIGFGDSEALYACYAMHPAAAYLDHPGLIGIIARLLGGGSAPSPRAVHLFTATAATLFPWFFALSARATGASIRGSLCAAIGLALIPEIAIGLFGFTPDLFLAYAWMFATALAIRGVSAKADSVAAVVSFLGAGLVTGLACVSKVSGVLLWLALLVAYAAPSLRASRTSQASQASRAHARTIWPWAGLFAAAIIPIRIVVYERQMGWPMIQHRLVDSQMGAGWSVRNIAAFVAGQFAYLSPLVAIALIFVIRHLWTQRRSSPVFVVLFSTFFIAAVPLALLCLWSRVAEPHWFAPVILPAAFAFAHSPDLISRRFALAAATVSGIVVAAVHAWVLTPDLVRLAPASYEPRFDIANELYGWPEVTAHVREIAGALQSPTETVIVGPHWIVCAQLHAALGTALPVGCNTPIADDFDTWLPRSKWSRFENVIWVSDNRFEEDPAPVLNDHVLARQNVMEVTRGGRHARTFEIRLYLRRGMGMLGR